MKLSLYFILSVVLLGALSQGCARWTVGNTRYSIDASRFFTRKGTDYINEKAAEQVRANEEARRKNK